LPKISSNGIEINYVDAGRGEPLVLVHNIIASSKMFDFNIPVLSKHFRVISPDLRGHGQSSKPESKSEYSFDILAEDLHALLGELKIDSCYLLGQAAVGVGAIFTFYMKYPQMVKALIPVSGSTLAQPPLAAGEMPRVNEAFERMREAARTGGMMAALEERKTSMLFWIDKTLNTPAIYDRFEEMYRQTEVTAFLSLPEPPNEEQRQKLIRQYKSKPVPTMLLLGMSDTNPENSIQGMKQICPDLHAVLLPESGHYPAIENPEDFNRAVLNFIAGVRSYN